MNKMIIAVAGLGELSVPRERQSESGEDISRKERNGRKGNGQRMKGKQSLALPKLGAFASWRENFL
jgi:hypothetical protein